MKKLGKILLAIFGLSAFKIGVLITGLIFFVAAEYYFSSIAEKQESGLLNFIDQVHQKTIDFRFLARGEREVDPKVALITVDEKAVEKLGRWPWPRKVIGDMIATLIDGGAKVVAFDAIFSEPDQMDFISSLNRIKQKSSVSPDLQSAIEAELKKADTDQIFADTVEKYADQVIMGTYFDFEEVPFHPFQELCSAKVTARSRAYQELENEETSILVLDPFAAELPEFLDEALDAELDRVTEETKAKHPEPKNFSQRIELGLQINQEMKLFCANWLTNEDPMLTALEINWPAVQQSSEELAEISFQEFLSTLRDGTRKNSIQYIGRLWTNIAQVSENVKHSGYFNAFLDSDGTVRRSKLIARYGDQNVASLALKTLMVTKNLTPLVRLGDDPNAFFRKAVLELDLNNEDGEKVSSIPVDTEGAVAINYAGPRYMYPHVSVYELFNGKDTMQITQRVKGENKTLEVKKKDFLKDKIFLFGATAIGIFDLRVTPFDENYPGLETHANLVDNLLNQNYLTKTPLEKEYLPYALLILGLIFSFALSRMGAVPGLVLTIATLAGIYFVDKFYLFRAGTVVVILFPILLVSVIYISLNFYKYLTEERKKKELKGTFEKYVSPAIVNEILSDPEKLELGGRKERMTVLFSDIRGFTTISEKLDASALSDLLNDYLSPMTRLVFENNGTLDKYMGDAIMAFFGAPIHYADHAAKACRCSLEMLDMLKVLQDEFAAKNLPFIDIGIGLNTGEMSVGNMGSNIVRSYTVMGDAVNLGSRLEGINKQYGTRIIISEFTHGDIKDDFITREIDWVRVKGKLEPVRIFELVAEKEAPSQVQMKLDHFIQGFELYHKMDFDGALEQFNSALEVDAGDAPSKLYVQRCLDYQQQPPPADWDGVFQMTTK
jgi:adenylate cyclase